jgi:hypothetical protein
MRGRIALKHTPFAPAEAGAQLSAKAPGSRFREDERVGRKTMWLQ